MIFLVQISVTKLNRSRSIRFLICGAQLLTPQPLFSRRISILSYLEEHGSKHDDKQEPCRSETAIPQKRILKNGSRMIHLAFVLHLIMFLPSQVPATWSVYQRT